MQPDISVVVPMKNEEPNIDGLYRELTAALEAYGRPYEIIAIDDGSNDGTFNRLALLQASDHRLRVIRFRRNFGQTAGFAAGFARARGRYIVTMDGDLQNDPRDIGPDGRCARAHAGGHRRRLAQGSQGRVHQPPTAVDDRELADFDARRA